jgi:hypothetical protein
MLVVLVASASLVAVFVRARQGRYLPGSDMGLNLQPGLRCPACEAPVPQRRRPQNLRQAMWGGWTCVACGAEFDKWLKPRS